MGFFDFCQKIAKMGVLGPFWGPFLSKINGEIKNGQKRGFFDFLKVPGGNFSKFAFFRPILFDSERKILTFYKQNNMPFSQCFVPRFYRKAPAQTEEQLLTRVGLQNCPVQTKNTSTFLQGFFFFYTKRPGIDGRKESKSHLFERLFWPIFIENQRRFWRFLSKIS